MKSHDQVEKDIQDAYGSTVSPSWSFVEPRYSKTPYANLVDQLSVFDSAQESTDLNNDVSVVLSIDLDGDIGVTLRLSLVGRYACIADSHGRFLSLDELNEGGLARNIVEILKSENIIFVNPEALTKTIVFAKDTATIYEILFSCDEAIA